MRFELFLAMSLTVLASTGCNPKKGAESATLSDSPGSQATAMPDAELDQLLMEIRNGSSQREKLVDVMIAMTELADMERIGNKHVASNGEHELAVFYKTRHAVLQGSTPIIKVMMLHLRYRTIEETGGGFSQIVVSQVATSLDNRLGRKDQVAADANEPTVPVPASQAGGLPPEQVDQLLEEFARHAPPHGPTIGTIIEMASVAKMIRLGGRETDEGDSRNLRVGYRSAAPKAAGGGINVYKVLSLSIKFRSVGSVGGPDEQLVLDDFAVSMTDVAG